MKSISYLDMVKEILNESEFFEFEKCYNNPVKKSIKILNHRWYKNNKSDLHNIIYSTISKEWDLSEPDFSYNWNKYNDVLFATRKEDLKPSSLWSHYLHQAWLIYVQEMAASLSVQMLWVQKWDYVLDMCAAPWGKSVQIADNLMLGNGLPLSRGNVACDKGVKIPLGSAVSPFKKGEQDFGFLISNEIDQWRRKALEANFHRCWIFNVWVIGQDWCCLWDKLPETFDKVLVDAPCSWEWMQYKSDKKVWQRDEKKSRKLSELQTQLLISWLKSLKAWGELVYSTCTTNVLENEYVVSEVLKQYWDKIELLPVPLDEKSDWICSWGENEILSSENAKKVARLWPHVHWTGGFFIAKFRKNNNGLPLSRGNVACDKGVKIPLGSAVSPFKKGEQNILPTPLNKGGNPKDGGIMPLVKGGQELLLSTWWISPIPDLDFFISKYTVNIAPKSLIQSHFENKISNIEIWLPIFKILEDKKNNSQKLIPLVWIAQIFGHLATQNVLEINDEQLKLLMEKRDLVDERLKDYEWNFVILKWNWVGVWLVSVQKWIWKNKCF